MKKIIFVIVAVLGTAVTRAQDSLNASNSYTNKENGYGNDESPTLDKTLIWSIGLEPSMPVGHFHDLANFGFGGSVQAEIKAGRNIGITINGGYISYSGKTVDTVQYPNFKYWPVMGGLKVYMGKAYLHGQAGAGFGEDNLGTSFWYGAGVGINFTKKIDAEFRYAGWKQNEVTSGEGGNGGIYNGGTGTPVYGGHYSTLGFRLAVNF